MKLGKLQKEMRDWCVLCQDATWHVTWSDPYILWIYGAFHRTLEANFYVFTADCVIRNASLGKEFQVRGTLTTPSSKFNMAVLLITTE